MSIHTTQQNSDTPTETVWTANSGTMIDDNTTPPQNNTSKNTAVNSGKARKDVHAALQVSETITTSQPRTSPIKGRLKPNSKRILDIIATQETRNASAAYKEVHPTASDITARTNAYKLLKTPSSQVYLQTHTTQAVNNILELANSARSELVRLNANQDILDRNFGKATIKQEQVTTGVTLIINLTGQDQQ